MTKIYSTQSTLFVAESADEILNKFQEHNDMILLTQIVMEQVYVNHTPIKRRLEEVEKRFKCYVNKRHIIKFVEE